MYIKHTASNNIFKKVIKPESDVCFVYKLKVSISRLERLHITKMCSFTIQNFKKVVCVKLETFCYKNIKQKNTIAELINN